MKNIHYIDIKSFLFCITTLFIGACNVDQHIPAADIEISETDEIFISDANYINRLGIEYARLAETISDNGLILAYAERMMDEHSVADIYLLAIAEDLEVALSTEIHSEGLAFLDQLSGKSGPAFDSLYIQRNIEIHLWAQVIMEEQISTTNVEVLTNYANQQLLQVNQRLNDALLIQSELQ